MPAYSRRDALALSGLAAAFGLIGPLGLDQTAAAQQIADPAKGFHRHQIGDVTVTAVYDGIWEKPHDPGFIRNASVEETKEALAKAGQRDDFVPIPLSVQILTIGGRHIMIDAGSGGQWQPTAGKLHANMRAAGIDPAAIQTILISHFHPDHILGLMERGTNAPVYPNAELIVTAAEYRWWTEPGRVEKLPEGRKAMGQRINSVLPTWKNIRQVEGEPELAPGLRLIFAPGHTPGHAAFHLSSGKDQLMISNDIAYLPSLLAPNPEWQGVYDQDGPLAIQSRRKVLDRAAADRMLVTGAHFPFPGAGHFAKDGDAYSFSPLKI